MLRSAQMTFRGLVYRVMWELFGLPCWETRRNFPPSLCSVSQINQRRKPQQCPVSRGTDRARIPQTAPPDILSFNNNSLQFQIL
jgi:hypothetical protein